jgi:hypothetical protein
MSGFTYLPGYSGAYAPTSAGTVFVPRKASNEDWAMQDSNLRPAD